MISKNLAVFDFDYTVVSRNTDTEIVKLLETTVPPEVKEIIDNKGWTEFMAEIFRLLYEKNCDKTKIHETIINIPETKGMSELFTNLHEVLNYDIIIISDSNLVFIQDWLQAHGLKRFVKEIFTNPASYNKNGLLTIQPYQDQKECDLCNRNLCKGSVMKKYIEISEKLGVQYVKVIYAGDGVNDFCPMIKLRKDVDIAFPRTGFRIMDKIEMNKNNVDLAVKATVRPWDDAGDILKVLKE